MNNAQKHFMSIYRLTEAMLTEPMEPMTFEPVVMDLGDNEEMNMS